MKPDDPPTSKRPPGVSVVIPAFDAEAFVGAAVESVLAQTHPRVEASGSFGLDDVARAVLLRSGVAMEASPEI